MKAVVEKDIQIERLSSMRHVNAQSNKYRWIHREDKHIMQTLCHVKERKKALK